MEKSEIFAAVKRILIDNFEIKSELISPDKLLSDDLEMDSLDVVDLLLYMEGHLAGRPSPSLFKNATTVQDIVDTLYPVWKKAHING
ncbi:MAG: phosphopantetheine-binding protein [Treponema sp.]|jgi:acyl carrier protein|nr:phosphopantetheine-binding protein [Treponema sp.]